MQEADTRPYLKKAIIVSIITLVILGFIYVFFLLRSSKQKLIDESSTNVTPTIIQMTIILPTSTPYVTPSSQPITITSQPLFGETYDGPLDQKFYDEIRNKEANERPDIFVSDATPYSESSFYVASEFINASPYGYYKIIIYKLVEDEKLVENKFKEWLLSLGLTEQSIDKLKIEYRSIAKALSE